MTQIWLAVDEDGIEVGFEKKPIRNEWSGWVRESPYGGILQLPEGSIERLIGRKLTWDDEAVLVEDEEE